LTNPDNPNIINFDLWKQAAGGRHQIGTLAGFKSEQVAGFLLECMAGFVGIRTSASQRIIKGTSLSAAMPDDRFREEFRTLASVRKSPKNEPAVQGMSYGDLRFEAASGGGVLTASSVVKAGLWRRFIQVLQLCRT